MAVWLPASFIVSPTCCELFLALIPNKGCAIGVDVDRKVTLVTRDAHHIVSGELQPVVVVQRQFIGMRCVIHNIVVKAIASGDFGAPKEWELQIGMVRIEDDAQFAEAAPRSKGGDLIVGAHRVTGVTQPILDVEALVVGRIV